MAAKRLPENMGFNAVKQARRIAAKPIFSGSLRMFTPYPAGMV